MTLAEDFEDFVKLLNQHNVEHYDIRNCVDEKINQFPDEYPLVPF